MEKEKVKDLANDLRCFHAEYKWVIHQPGYEPKSTGKQVHSCFSRFYIRPLVYLQAVTNLPPIPPVIVHCECNAPWPVKPNPKCPCFNKKAAAAALAAAAATAPPVSAGGSAAAAGTAGAAPNKALPGITGTYVRYERKRDKREKTSLDLWHEIQTELFLYMTGENKKCNVSIHGMGKAEKSKYGRASNGIRGLQTRFKHKVSYYPVCFTCLRSFTHKHGRVRANLTGKRQDFSARTVITGSNDVDVFEIGIPLSFAEILTVPETVQVSLTEKKNACSLHFVPYSHTTFTTSRAFYGVGRSTLLSRKTARYR